MLAKASWRWITWRRGTKGPLRARFAAVRVRVADGPAVQLRGHAAQHLPGDEVWLVGEHRSSGERKYYLSNLPSDTTLKQLNRVQFENHGFGGLGFVRRIPIW
jgi:SRSO17 transposase